MEDKIFGKSAEFENMLHDSYTNPLGWLEGPEGSALNRIVQNQALRTDARGGNLSNDINRSVLLQDKMMQGIGNYRQGLTQAANLGRAPSSVVVNAVGKGLEGGNNAASWYTPLMYGPGQKKGQTPGGAIKDIWNTATPILQDIWNWATGD